MHRPFSLSFCNECGKGAAMLKHELYVPPEWAIQSAVWVGWPHIRGEWGPAFDGARAEITGFIQALSAVTPVRVACGSREAYGSAWMALEPEIDAGRVTLYTLPAGDIWLRDTGPILAQQNGHAIALAFAFNGWGGKYIMPGDTMTAGGIASVERVDTKQHEFIFEGGAIDLDGQGRLLTTRQCLLNPNRNPGWTQTDAEAALKDAFGVEQIIWLDDGLLNDHTDGHVDNIARFIGPGRVACQIGSGDDDPNAETYRSIRAALAAAQLDIVDIPSPGRIADGDGNVAPASHMNFLISNRHVFVPIYEAAFAPRALAAFEQALPGYKIIGLPANNILSGGGAFHCMTQQVPDFSEDTP